MILIDELDDLKSIVNDLRHSKSVREAALRRVRQLEDALGFPASEQTSHYNRPDPIDRVRDRNHRRHATADILVSIGWVAAIVGCMLLVTPIDLKLAIGVTMSGFIVALIGAMVRP
jgi:hypothetical protein